MRWVGHVARIGDRRGLHWLVLGKPQGKRPLERPRLRWQDTIKMEIQDVEWLPMDLTDLAQDTDTCKRGN